MNAHTIWCGLSLFVIVGVVVIPWTQQESTTPFFLWYGNKRHQMEIFQENGLFGAKDQKGIVIIPPQYIEMQPFSCGLSLVRNHQYQYAYIDISNKKIVPFGKYSWCDPQFICNYARVKLLDNINWGIIDVRGEIAVYPNLDYIAPLESFTTWGNHIAVKIKGRYKGENVGYIIDSMTRVNLPIDFEFMPDFKVEKLSSSDKTKNHKKNKLYTYDNQINDSNWGKTENWEDQWLDAFEGDESNYWNIE